MIETSTTPRCRVRINHKHTVREGWGIGETTAEFEWDGMADDIKAAELGKLMRLAHHEGSAEARRRNEAGRPGKTAA